MTYGTTMPSGALQTSYRGPIHERIERHNRYLLASDCVAGYAIACVGTRVANYLMLHPGGQARICCDVVRSAISTTDGTAAWVQDEAHATVEEKTLATQLMGRYADEALWRFTRLVVVGCTGVRVFDYPTIGGE